MKYLYFFLTLTCSSIYGQIFGDLQYATPQSTYPSNSNSYLQSVYDLNQKLSNDYNTNKSDYERTLSSLNTKKSEASSKLVKSALAYVVEHFNSDLQSYTYSGRWEDAGYTLQTARNNLKINYDNFINEQNVKIKESNNSGYEELKKKNPQMAIEWFDASLARDDKNISALYGKALANHDQKLYNQSNEIILDLLSLNSKEPVFYSLQGRNFFYLNKFGSAIESFKKAVDLGNKDGDLYFLAICRHRAKDYTGAISDLNKYIIDNSTDEHAYFLRASCKSELGDYSGALIDYQKCIELEPSFSMAFNNLAWTKFLQKEYKVALTYANKAIELDKNNATAFDTRAEIKYNLADYKGAILDCDAEWSLDINSANCYLIRGKCKLKLQKKKDACFDLSKAGELGKIEAYELIQKNCK